MKTTECRLCFQTFQAYAQIFAQRVPFLVKSFVNVTKINSSNSFFYVTYAQELTISKEVGDRSSEASTHGNLAVAYQALGSHEMALVHYHSHLNIARELKDVAGEACALCNLGNCHSSKGKKLGK